MRGRLRVGEGERDKKGMKRKTKEGRREIKISARAKWKTST